MTKTIQLNQIRIAAPCSADWNSMAGDDRRRFCKLCELNVYNISEMTEQEATAFIANSEGRVCIRLYRRQDGTVITQDCPLGLAAIRRRVRRMWTATLALAGMLVGGVALAALTKRRSSARWQQPLFQIRTMSEPIVEMGDICPAPLPTTAATPQTASSQAATPQTATPQTATPQTATPQTATPQTVSPQAAEDTQQQAGD